MYIRTLAGVAGSSGTTNGTLAAARFNGPIGLDVDSAGNIYVADSLNNTIRKISEGVVTTLAGTPSLLGGSVDGTGAAARFNQPTGVAVDAAGNVYVADYSAHTIRKITSSGEVTTFAGDRTTPGTSDGTGTAAKFNFPRGVAVDAAGNVYVADHQSHTIRKITSAGVVTTIAGTAQLTGSTNATGAAARFLYPSGVAVDTSGNIFVADYGNHTIRKITSAGVVTTIAGTAGSSGTTDGTGSAARFYRPHGIKVDSAGNIYVAEYSNHTIRKITTAGVVTTVAGTAGTLVGSTQTGYGSADGTDTNARFNSPSGVTVDSSGNIFVADYGNHTIRSSIQTAATITFGAIPATVPGLGPFNVNPTSNSGGPIVLTSSNPAIASVNGFVITPNAAGTVTITASQASYLYFSAATPVSQTLVVNQFLAQTITFSDPNTPPKTDQSLEFAATVTASSGLPVVLTSSNPALAIGVTTITASQAGNLIYSPTSTSRVLTVSGTTATATATINYVQNCSDMQYYTGKQETIYVTTNPPQLAWPNSTTCRISPSSSSNKLSFGSAQLRNDGTTQYDLNQAEPPDPGTKTLTFTLSETDKYAQASVQRSILVSRPTLSISTYEREASYGGFVAAWTAQDGTRETSVFGGDPAGLSNYVSNDFYMTMLTIRLEPSLLNCAGSQMGSGYANSEIPMIIFGNNAGARLMYYNSGETASSAGFVDASINSQFGYGINLLDDPQKSFLDIVPVSTTGIYRAGGQIRTTGGNGNVFISSVAFGGEYMTPNLVFGSGKWTPYRVPFVADIPSTVGTIDPRITTGGNTTYGKGTNDPRITRKIKPAAGLVYIGSGYSGTVQQSNTVQTALELYITNKVTSESSSLLDPTKPRFGFSVYTSPYLPYRSGYVGDYYDMPPGQSIPLNFANQFGGFSGSQNWANFFALQPVINCYKIGEFLL